ncbi:carbohydrate sulfotransferase 11 isoform X1 [Aedes aegypti]|uniref:Carbohydrate sulfotransferase n=1 Tax=Aedes aegypti TaxID=7159 RepID=A0A6I8TBV0_AEDAE|nr:carbohydrate sulfotransferase 11 isoform X1 [Aedes aegypti]XP_021695553.1 carbohydrate sulfotransferase 11 isoform X1 [Aedes aegypti]XP_021695554.1 carbohydrate sulfotransferase 11 isoform X1 [Aedes aegypti]XP_021695555.1 carbohydrate sulfotransferase 11 isoform X1 [Aedes aegypti]
MKGLNRTKCRIVRRLFLFFATLSVIPFTVLYLVTSDHLYRFRAYNYGTGTNGSRHQLQYHAVHHPPPAVVHHQQQQQHRKHQQTHDQQLQHKAIKNSTSNQYQIDMDYMKHRMEDRVTRLNDKCNEYRLNEPKQNYKPKAWEYLINREYHLVWCNVFKAASTSWMYNFNLLAGYTPEFLKKTKDVPLQLARQRYPRPSVDALREAINGSISFVIVRHPFERLVSAYKDKIQYALPNSHHHKLGIRIIQKYRKLAKGQQPWNTQKYPTFSEFVNYLLDEVRHPHTEIDMHWIPVTYFCTPCFFHYDVIAKFETLEEDQNYLIAEAQLGHMIKPQWRNAGKGAHTNDLVVKLFTELDDEQVRGLYEYYKYDFELFGYSTEEYFSGRGR